jgi:hypothetical protein
MPRSRTARWPAEPTPITVPPLARLRDRLVQSSARQVAPLVTDKRATARVAAEPTRQSPEVLLTLAAAAHLAQPAAAARAEIRWGSVARTPAAPSAVAVRPRPAASRARVSERRGRHGSERETGKPVPTRSNVGRKGRQLFNLLRARDGRRSLSDRRSRHRNAHCAQTPHGVRLALLLERPRPRPTLRLSRARSVRAGARPSFQSARALDRSVRQSAVGLARVERRFLRVRPGKGRGRSSRQPPRGSRRTAFATLL